MPSVIHARDDPDRIAAAGPVAKDAAKNQDAVLILLK